MPTQVKVIIGKNIVYATYVKTICFMQTFKGETGSAILGRELQDCIRGAQSAAFSYALTFGTVSVEKIFDDSIRNSDDLLDYLEKCAA
jgi:hypothetical protein